MDLIVAIERKYAFTYRSTSEIDSHTNTHTQSFHMDQLFVLFPQNRSTANRSSSRLLAPSFIAIPQFPLASNILSWLRSNTLTYTYTHATVDATRFSLHSSTTHAICCKNCLLNSTFRFVLYSFRFRCSYCWLLAEAFFLSAFKFVEVVLSFGVDFLSFRRNTAILYQKASRLFAFVLLKMFWFLNLATKTHAHTIIVVVGLFSRNCYCIVVVLLRFWFINSTAVNCIVC